MEQTTPSVTDLELTYLPVKGRALPLLYLLHASSLKFTHKTITRDEWRALRAAGKAGPPAFPFRALPVLSYRRGEGPEIVLAETRAIARFLEEEARRLHREEPAHPDIQAQRDMIFSASSSFSEELQYHFGDPKWLASPAARKSLLDDEILPFLTSLEGLLSSLGFPSLSPSDKVLSAAAATTCAVLELVLDLFPYSLGSVAAGSGGQDGHGNGLARRFPRCDEVRKEVLQRAGVREFVAGRSSSEDWGAMPFGSKTYMAECAEEWDRETSIEA